MKRHAKETSPEALLRRRAFYLRLPQETLRDGLKIRVITYVKDRQEIDFSTITGDANYASNVQAGRRGNRLIYWMVQCRYRT
jgi:hypothetical protein